MGHTIIRTDGTSATDKFKEDYDNLIQRTFGFSFYLWFEQGVWDQDYECYSIMDGHQMIANVSVFKMSLVVRGKSLQGIQLGAVATRKEYRGQGLARELMTHILDRYPDSPMFLFANDDVTQFYPKFGLNSVKDFVPVHKFRLDSGAEPRRLHMDDPKVDMYLRERAALSQVFDCTNQYSVNWFHILYAHQDHIYEIPEHNVMLIAEQREKKLVIHDIVARQKVTFQQIAPYLPFTGVDTIEFGFNPDWLELEYEMVQEDIDDSTTFVRGEFGLEGQFIIPKLIRT